MHTHTYIHAYILHTSIHSYIHTYICRHTHTHTHTHIYIYTQTHGHTHSYLIFKYVDLWKKHSSNLFTSVTKVKIQLNWQSTYMRCLGRRIKPPQCSQHCVFFSHPFPMIGVPKALVCIVLSIGWHIKISLVINQKAQPTERWK